MTTQNPDLITIKGRQQKAWSAGDYGKVGVTLLMMGELKCGSGRCAQRGSGAGTMPRGPERDRMSRAVEEWTVEGMKCEGIFCSSRVTGKAMAEVVS